MGFKSYEHDVEVNTYYGLITQETWRNMSFQKISSPMALGYDFKILKLKSTVYLGWKYSYYLKGKVNIYRHVYNTYLKDQAGNMNPSLKETLYYNSPYAGIDINLNLYSNDC